VTILLFSSIIIILENTPSHKIGNRIDIKDLKKVYDCKNDCMYLLLQCIADKVSVHSEHNSEICLRLGGITLNIA